MRTFEKADCGRCGGCGRYSWNAMHGDRCYGCNGRGYNLTKRGKQAHAAFEAIARPDVPVQDLKPGDKINVAGYRALEVSSVEPDTLNEGRVTIRFAEGSKLGGYGTFPGATVQKAKTAESHRAAWTAIADMPGVVQVAD